MDIKPSSIQILHQVGTFVLPDPISVKFRSHGDASLHDSDLLN